MISPFTPDEIDLVCCGHDHRAYVEQVGNVAGLRFDVRTLAGPCADPISTQPTREVHHPEGVFVAHWSD